MFNLEMVSHYRIEKLLSFNARWRHASMVRSCVSVVSNSFPNFWFEEPRMLGKKRHDYCTFRFINQLQLCFSDKLFRQTNTRLQLIKLFPEQMITYTKCRFVQTSPQKHYNSAESFSLVYFLNPQHKNRMIRVQIFDVHLFRWCVLKIAFFIRKQESPLRSKGDVVASKWNW